MRGQQRELYFNKLLDPYSLEVRAGNKIQSATELVLAACLHRLVCARHRHITRISRAIRIRGALQRLAAHSSVWQPCMPYPSTFNPCTWPGQADASLPLAHLVSEMSWQNNPDLLSAYSNCTMELRLGVLGTLSALNVGRAHAYL